MTQGPLYVDTLQPVFSTASDPAAVTLTTSDQPIIPTQFLPNVGRNFFGYPGKAVRVRVTGQLTTAATPGNFNWRWYLGNNTSSNGSNVGAIGTVMTANWTNYVWTLEMLFRARITDPPSGLKMFTSGMMYIYTWGFLPFPFNNPTVSAVSSYVADPLYLSLQVNRTGSTVETIQVQDVLFESMN